MSWADYQNNCNLLHLLYYRAFPRFPGTWKRWTAASWERHCDIVIVNDSSQDTKQNKTKKHLDVTPHRPLSRWVQIKPDFNARLKLIWSHLITLRTVCSSFVSKHLERSSLVMNFYWQISTCYLSDQSAVWMHKFTDSASRTRRLIFDCRKTHDIWRDLHILNAFLRQPGF